MLEKLEEYREQKMNQEIALLEAERKREEDELKKARDKERKFAKYLEKQREKLQELTSEKQERLNQEKKEIELKKKKEKQLEQKKKKENELKKKQIEEYKHKKAIATEMLANADLGDYYDENSEEGDFENNEEDASRYLNKMIDQYKNRPKNEPDIDLEAELVKATNPTGQQRRPPAVM